MNDVQEFLARERLAKARRSFDELELRFSMELPGDPNVVDEIGVATEIRAGIRHVVNETVAKATTVVQDRDLSDQGKARRLENLAKDMRQRIANLQKVADGKLAKRLESLRKELGKPLVDLHQGDAVAAIRCMEIRNRLGGMNDSDRLSALWAAAEHGDIETLQAFSTAPRSFRLADDKAIAEAMNLHWQKQRPELAEQVDQLETVAEMLSSDFRTASNGLDNLGGTILDGRAVEGRGSE